MTNQPLPTTASDLACILVGRYPVFPLDNNVYMATDHTRIHTCAVSKEQDALPQSTTPVVAYHPSSSTPKGLFRPADPRLPRLSPITSDEQIHLTEGLDTGSEADATSPETRMA